MAERADTLRRSKRNSINVRRLAAFGIVVGLLGGVVPGLSIERSVSAFSPVWDNAIVKQSQRPSDPTAWLLVNGQRYWIPTAAVYNCLKAAGVQGPVMMTDADLNARPDQRGQHASCGAGNDPHGHLDGASAATAGKVRVRGWAVDRNVLSRAIEVHVYIGGKAGSGAEGHNLGAAATYRPDVNNVFPGYGNYHGFEKTLSTQRWGRQEICAYAINVGPGGNVLIGCRIVTIKAPLPSGMATTCAKSTTFDCLARFGYGAGSTRTWTESYYRYDSVSGFHNCTRFAAYFMYKYAGINDPGSSFGDAWNWGKTDAQGGQTTKMSMRERGYVVNTTPRIGSIAWWDRNVGKGSVGHVGIVVGVGVDYIIVASDNYRTGAVGSADVTKITKSGGPWPTGFIHIGL